MSSWGDFASLHTPVIMRLDPAQSGAPSLAQPACHPFMHTSVFARRHSRQTLVMVISPRFWPIRI